MASAEARHDALSDAIRHLGTLSTAVIVTVAAFGTQLWQPGRGRALVVWSLLAHVLCIMLSGLGVVTLSARSPDEQSRWAALYFYIASTVAFTAGMFLLVFVVCRRA